MYDVCIVGGGIAGLSCAITAAQKGYHVCILDLNKKLGKKIYATGNGKCNITNSFMDYRKCYHSDFRDYEKFLESSIGINPTETILSFFNDLGILCVQKNGYYYPMSMQASTVVWAMLDACKYLKIDIKENCVVRKVLPIGSEKSSVTATKEDYSYSLMVDAKTTNNTQNTTLIKAKKVVLSCGGKTYTKLGGTEFGYDLIRDLNIPMNKLRPCLCGVRVKDNYESIRGVRVQAKASLKWHNIIYEEQGELQITDYGLSGIMIFNLSSVIGRILEEDASLNVTLNFMQNVSEDIFLQTAKRIKHRTLHGLLNAYLPDKLAFFLLEQANYNPKQLIKETSKDELTYIYSFSTQYKVNIQELMDYETAQVTAGGVRLEEINPESFESRTYKGLYIVGEMLDVDGICGGYNITFAVLSGKKAGESIIC